MPNTRLSTAGADDDDALALRLVALLDDDQVLAKMRNVLFPQALANKLDSLTRAKVDTLTKQLTHKDEKLDILEKRIHDRCHGLRVYPVCVCNTVRLGQIRSRHNLKPSGTRFARVSGLSV